jgi:hypothetical protein
MKTSTMRQNLPALIWKNLRQAGRAWFRLTRQERIALLLVMVILAIGVIARRHLHVQPSPQPNATAQPAPQPQQVSATSAGFLRGSAE